MVCIKCMFETGSILMCSFSEDLISDLYSFGIGAEVMYCGHSAYILKVYVVGMEAH